MEGGRAKKQRIIVEGFVTFESEITLLTVRSVSGTSYLRADWSCAEGWRLHRIMAAACDEQPSKSSRRRKSPAK